MCSVEISDNCYSNSKNDKGHDSVPPNQHWFICLKHVWWHTQWCISGLILICHSIRCLSCVALPWNITNWRQHWIVSKHAFAHISIKIGHRPKEIVRYLLSIWILDHWIVSIHAFTHISIEIGHRPKEIVWHLLSIWIIYIWCLL